MLYYKDNFFCDTRETLVIWTSIKLLFYSKYQSILFSNPIAATKALLVCHNRKNTTTKCEVANQFLGEK